jgi:hypothetical protein
MCHLQARASAPRLCTFVTGSRSLLARSQCPTLPLNQQQQQQPLQPLRQQQVHTATAPQGLLGATTAAAWARTVGRRVGACTAAAVTDAAAAGSMRWGQHGSWQR